MTVANVLEFATFYNLISFTKKFLWLGHTAKEHPISGFFQDTFKKNFSAYVAAPFFVYIGLIKFSGYYLLNRLRQVPENTDYAHWDDILTVLQSLYPTTMLFSMTLTICFAHVIEEFFKAGLYSFNLNNHQH
uniref:Uncharacterized protein n=1 Tax=Acrobeloides nanus TaxID=290746 RepID=A0A914DNL6_9BILA